MRPSEYKKIIKLGNKLLMGYKYFYDSTHPLAYGCNGCILYHRHIMSIHLNRWIKKHELVHHINENKLDNRIENLRLTNRSEHGKIHRKPKIGFRACKCGQTFISKTSIKCPKCRRKTRKANPLYYNICPQCHCVFETTHKYQRFCSQDCSHVEQKRFIISKEELTNLIQQLPMTKIGKMFGVSDTAIKKRCISLGIDLNNRKYKKSNRG